MSAAVMWADSRGVMHDLTKEKRLSVSDAAIRIGVTKETVRRLRRRKELQPTIKHAEARCGRVEIYDCAIADYLARKLSAHSSQ